MINQMIITSKKNKFCEYMRCEEKSVNTIMKYKRDIGKFIEFLGNSKLDKNAVIAWKESIKLEYALSSVNSMLVAVNCFLEWLGCGRNKVKLIKCQKAIFSQPEKELSQEEYRRLVESAYVQNNHKLSLIIQTICGTGIRISELNFVTIEGVKSRRVLATSKGKSRAVLLPKNLCKKLEQYCKEEKITNGIIFRTKSGKAMNRSNIWKMMKGLCREAKVSQSKVFPHNLRHLFARTYYKIEKNITRLADILGHSNINTTRIYTMETGIEHIKQLDKMRLVNI